MASAKDKLTAVTSVKEPPDINFPVDFTLWTYSFQGKNIYTWNFESQVTDFRVLLNTAQASTVEIDLDDSDYEVLNDPLFAHWAWDIEDVSFSSQKKFRVTRLQNSTKTAYLGDSADLEWVLGKKPIDFSLGDPSNDIAFRLCTISTQKTTLTLSLEDRVASWLRDESGSKSWDRSQHTRAQFVAMLCREAGVDYFIPEINVVQPIAQDTTPSANPINNIANPNGKGLAKTPNLTVLGHRLTPTQIQVANILLGECDRLNAPLVCWQAILYAGVGETGLGTNSGTYSNNGSGAIGVLQGTDPFWDSHARDIAGQADSFLQGGKGFNSAIALAKAGATDMAEIAVKSEVPSIWPNNAYEKEWGSTKDAALRGEIDAIIGAYGGPSSTGAGTASTTGSYAFTRGANETSWDCIQRLASEVAWYAFVRQNRLWFVSGNYLFSQAAQLTAERGKSGVDYIDIDMDIGERDQIAQCMVYGRTSLWTALPGMVVEVVNRGPASGKWIVASVETHPIDATQEAIITLQKPLPKRAEPSAGSSNSQNKPKKKKPSGDFANPFPKGWVPNRLDWGYDGTFTSWVTSPVTGTITYASSSFSNWGGYIQVKADETPKGLPTDTFYFAEGIEPAPGIRAGARVNAGDVIGNPAASPFGDSYGTDAKGIGEIEWGIAASATLTNPPTPTDPFAKTAANPASVVKSFANWAVNTLGVKPPSQTDHAGFA